MLGVFILQLYMYHVFWVLGWTSGYEHEKPFRMPAWRKVFMALTWPAAYLMYLGKK
jgi:hypothetical protein